MNSYWIFVSSSRVQPMIRLLFESTVKSIKNFKTTMSIVFECHIYTLRQQYAESLLEQLIDDGLSGEELKKSFNRMMQI